MSSATPLWTDHSRPAGTELEVEQEVDQVPEALQQAYFQHVSEADVAELELGLAEQMVAAHHQLALDRHTEEAAVKITATRTATLVQIVHEDMPYLVDSVTGDLTRRGHAIRLVAHPIFIAHRDPDRGRLSAVHAVPSEQAMASGDTSAITDLGPLLATEASGAVTGVESWIGIVTVDPLTAEQATELEDGIRRALADVRAAVKDTDAMRSAAVGAAHDLERDAPSTVHRVRQSAELLTWMQEGHFTFTGYRQYVLTEGADGQVLAPVEGTGLGILRLRKVSPASPLTRAGQDQIGSPNPLVITKANSRSRVYRPAYLDYIAVKTYGEDGHVIGEHRFLGLWDAKAYTASVQEVPLVRDKVDQVLRSSGFPPTSHSGAELQQILESYPREELFQIDVKDLWQTCRQILQLQERRRTRLFLRPDVFGRFMTALVFLPRDRFNTSVRRRIQDQLIEALDGDSIDFQVRLTESVLARLYFRIRLPRGIERLPAVDVGVLEQKLVDTVRSWREALDERALATLGEEGPAAARIWDEAFPPAYRVAYEIEDALEDIGLFNQIPQDGAPVVRVHPESAPSVVTGEASAEDLVTARMKLYSDRPRTLSEILPVLQHLGLSVQDERPYEVTPSDGRTFMLYDLGLVYPPGVEPAKTSELLAQAVVAAMTEATESDAFDRLVLELTLPVRAVTMLRAYAKYLRQLGVPNSFTFMAGALRGNPEVARALVEYFQVRFDPQAVTRDNEGDNEVADVGAGHGPDAGPARRRLVDEARQRVQEALEAVPTLDADRVLSGFLTVMQATQRTNFYQGHERLSFKVAPRQVPFAPEPRPAHEVWVYAPGVEGTHLRYGAVARGGLRWSDRQEDFRTEVLGLVKAQQVKNAVIVPTGAKGGFYAKRLPDPAQDRGAWMEAGKQAYRTFIRGLLDITDNQHRTGEGGDAVEYSTREGIVRYDGDDAYLVVAADKGTASFSDIANEISAEYGHWLGDAFASGGSVGYDHKAMGITARGAWESVKSHFASLGRDTQSQDFTVVGIGDMSGDVFGNGMLLSHHIRLVAAFNHLHVFLDPDPDAETSFAERQRLFGLTRSGWADYDRSLISEGGGIYERTAKSVPISEQVRRVLQLPEDTVAMAPSELIQAILTAPVDLLYNGGIGTYVKATEETHEQVGDRANNPVRVDGEQLRATVVGEGGNLGFTQRGRVEAALNGALLNTDAIDNSAGVDCSDHEVNIKIMVDQLVATGRLEAGERTGLLESMTDEVARLVLENNIEQNVLLRNDGQRVSEWLPSFVRHLDWLVEHAGLDRRLESLPDHQVLAERQDSEHNVTTPELAVLAAYTKIHLTQELLESGMPDDPWFAGVLDDYFPVQLRERYAEQIHHHPLRRQIIATMVANDVVNTMGITSVFRAMEETGMDAPTIVHSYAAIKEIFDVDGFAEQMRHVPATLPGELKARVWLDMRRLVDRSMRWLVNHRMGGESVDDEVDFFAEDVRRLNRDLPELLQGQDAERYHQWLEQARADGLPEPLAQRRATQFESFGLLDVVLLARESGRDPHEVAEIYYLVYDRFEADGMLNRISALSREDRWQALARAAMRDDLYTMLVDITSTVLDDTEEGEEGEDRPRLGEQLGSARQGASPATAAARRVDRWVEHNASRIDRAARFLREIDESGTDNIATLSVALRQLRSVTSR